MHTLYTAITRNYNTHTTASYPWYLQYLPRLLCEPVDADDLAHAHDEVMQRVTWHVNANDGVEQQQAQLQYVAVNIIMACRH